MNLKPYLAKLAEPKVLGSIIVDLHVYGGIAAIAYGFFLLELGPVGLIVSGIITLTIGLYARLRRARPKSDRNDIRHH